MFTPRIASILTIGLLLLAIPLHAQSTTNTFMVNGRPLSEWIASAANDPSGPELDVTVEALALVMEKDDLMMRVEAGDALAKLGPKAKAAIPALLTQLAHDLPWVRASAQGALASMGEVSVPALIETFQADLGGPSVRAAFVLGGMGEAAKPFIPILEEAMKNADPVFQDRYRGVLSNLAPEKYQARTGQTQAQFDAVAAGEGPAFDPGLAGDWPQFHGPARDSISRETHLLEKWPEEGPKQRWQLDGLGKGYSTVSIANGTLYTMGDLELPGQEEQQYVLAYDLQTRKRLWTTPIGPPHKDGPRCTPTIEGGKAYAIGTDGGLLAVDAETGKVIWQKHLVNDFGGKVMSGWMYSESPLIDNEKLICTPGGNDAVLVALNKHTGETLWKTVLPDLGENGVDGAGYSSVVAANIEGKRQYVQVIGRGVIGVDADTGECLWGYNKIANTVANITAPAVRGSYVFVSTAYSTGSIRCEGSLLHRPQRLSKSPWRLHPSRRLHLRRPRSRKG